MPRPGVLLTSMRFDSSLSTNDSWCNGNTAVFGTAIQGSSPCESTKTITMNLYKRLKPEHRDSINANSKLYPNTTESLINNSTKI